MTTPLGAGAPDGKLALVMGGSGLAWTFGELQRRTDEAVAMLAARGLRFGDHIAVLFANEPELFPVVWAAQRTGLYYTPVNWHLTPDEAAYIVADCGAKVLVASPAHRELTERIRAAVPAVVPVVTGAGPAATDARDVARTTADAGLPQRWEGFAMFYSSGTTGRPKGIARAAVRTPLGTAGPIDALMRRLYGLGPDCVYLSTGPLYHAAPLGWSTATQRAGGTTVVMERFDALHTLELIERYRVTHVQFVPTMMKRLLRLSAEDRRRYDLSSLRAVIHAAAPCPVDLKREIIGWLGPIVWEYYAGSEGNGYFAIDSADWLAHPGSVGRAMYGTPHVLDDDGTELPPGEIGTIWFEGTTAFAYHNDAEKTAGAFNDKGWSTLGDVGRLDGDGYLYLSDRRVDLIISGGVNIYPQEVENVLTAHPAVYDAAVVGVPDEEMGQRVVAVVQAEPGAGPDLAERLSAHCRAHLAGFKCPREVVFTEELPRLPSGKLLRRWVRDWLAGGPAAPA
ncbi:MAG TPA: AMP-binding protein [Trebonia sp.]|jgi:acyl-CoA synthetase (AMP-forming)/AMP-acid ligase II|nr:AMP-binding protein [Trebonia sp.]